MLTKSPYKKYASLSGLQTRSKRMDAFIDKWREITSDPEILNIVLVFKIPLRCKLVQNAHLMNAEVESPCKRRHSTSLPHKRGLLQSSIPGPEKDGAFQPVKYLGFLKTFVENSHFQLENISSLKFLLQRVNYVNTLDLKDAYLSVPSTGTLKSLYSSSEETNAMSFKASVLAEILFQGFLTNS